MDARVFSLIAGLLTVTFGLYIMNGESSLFVIGILLFIQATPFSARHSVCGI